MHCSPVTRPPLAGRPAAAGPDAAAGQADHRGARAGRGRAARSISVAGIAVLRGYLLGQADNQLRALAMHSTRVVGTASARPPARATPWTWPSAWVQRGHDRMGRPAGRQYGQPGSMPSARAQSRRARQRRPGWPRTQADPVTVAGRPARQLARRRLHRVMTVTQQFTDRRPGRSPLAPSSSAIDVTSVYRTIGQLTSIDLIVSVIVLIGAGRRRRGGGPRAACGR